MTAHTSKGCGRNMILYFSATGNCKYVAERIAGQFGDAAVSIENADGQVHLSENEMLGIVTPVNWLELPVLVREFLRKMSVEKNGEPYSFIVTTYGTKVSERKAGFRTMGRSGFPSAPAPPSARPAARFFLARGGRTAPVLRRVPSGRSSARG